MGSVAENLAAVQERIDAACRSAGRDPADVRLLPVSKTHGPGMIAEAYEAGVRLFGENRVQEAAEKAELFADRPDLGWAIIGHLQTNKAKLRRDVRIGVPRAGLHQGGRGARPAPGRGRTEP